jgi:Holliday junction resolvase RusA-like endonuclease
MFTIRLDLNPVPASRPRVTRWGTYYGKRHQAFRSECAALLKQELEQRSLPVPLSGGFQVRVIFLVKKPKRTILDSPRGDIDNYIKLLLDCCNGVLWDDDRDCVVACGFKCWHEGDGAIYLSVREMSVENSNAIRSSFEQDPEGEHPESPNVEGFSFCC